MTNFIRFPLKGVQVEIQFETVDELDKRLVDLDPAKLSAVIQARLGETAALADPRLPGLETIYVRGPDGLPQMLEIPASGVDAVALGLFLAAPRYLTGTELAQVSGVEDAPRKYFSQASYKDLFTKDSKGAYGLTHKGRVHVTSTVLPALRKEERIP